MSYEYSENILVQQAASDILEQLGWQSIFAYNEETLGENGTLGRKNYHQVILSRYFRQALFQNNDWMTEEYASQAEKIFTSHSSAESLIQINKQKHELIKNGIPVDFKKPNGTTEKHLHRRSRTQNLGRHLQKTCRHHRIRKRNPLSLHRTQKTKRRHHKRLQRQLHRLPDTHPATLLPQRTRNPRKRNRRQNRSTQKQIRILPKLETPKRRRHRKNRPRNTPNRHLQTGKSSGHN